MDVPSKNSIGQYGAGFTILELLLYIGIASTVLLSASIFLSLTLEARVKNAALSEVEGQGVFLADLMGQTVRNSTGISAPSIGTTGSSLSVTTVSGATSPTVFSVASGALRVTEGAGAAVSLTNSRVAVSGLSISNLSRSGTPGTVRVSFTITYNNPSGRNEFDVSKTFTFSATRKQP